MGFVNFLSNFKTMLIERGFCAGTMWGVPFTAIILVVKPFFIRVPSVCDVNLLNIIFHGLAF